MKKIKPVHISFSKMEIYEHRSETPLLDEFKFLERNPKIKEAVIKGVVEHGKKTYGPPQNDL